MHLDAATLLVVMIAVGIMTVAVFVAVDRAMPRRFAGLRTWTLSYAAITAGLVAVVAQPTTPGPLLLASGNTLLVGGFALAFAASRQMVERAVPWRALAALVAFSAALLAYGIFVVDSFAVRTLVVMGCEVLLYGTASVELLRAKVPGRGDGIRLVSLLFAGLALASTVRFVSQATGDNPGSVLGMSGIHVATLAVQAVTLAGVGVGVVLFFHEKLRADLEAEAWTDPLTGIWTRRAFFKVAERERKRCLRSGDAYSLLVVDLDDFKRVNDAWGHTAGDQALAKGAAAVREALRGSDLVGRYGGEELIALLPGSGVAAFTDAAERVRAAVEAITVPGFPDLGMTVSIGLAASAEPGEPLDSVFRRADAALYRAKARGKNRVEADIPVLAAKHPPALDAG